MCNIVNITNEWLQCRSVTFFLVSCWWQNLKSGASHHDQPLHCVRCVLLKLKKDQSILLINPAFLIRLQCLGFMTIFPANYFHPAHRQTSTHLARWNEVGRRRGQSWAGSHYQELSIQVHHIAFEMDFDNLKCWLAFLKWHFVII